MEGVFRTIPAFLEDRDLPEQVREAIIVSAWGKAAGDALSVHAVAIGTDEKTLRIAVRDLIWKRHLESLSGQMIFRLNSILRSPAVTYLEFFVDEDTVKQAVRQSGSQSLSNKEFEALASREEGDDLKEAAEEISDPGLRDLFLNAAVNCLARKRRLSGASGKQAG
ncbi:MAG TPA: DciA family protein [Aridibacter sp.]|nr:DciA family protein [Aridibacter sp.]